VWEDPDTDRGGPGDEPDNTVLGITPPLLDVDKKTVESVYLGVYLGELGLVLFQLGLRVFDVDSILHLTSERVYFLLEMFDRVDVRVNERLDGGQVLRERGRAYDKDLLLGCRA
jgi:hypothetical protein